MFSKEVEEDIALFLKHCTFLRVPRTKTMLRDDILHYVQYKQLDVPRMPEDGPCRIHLIFDFSYSKSSTVVMTVWNNWSMTILSVLIFFCRS